MTLSPEVLLGVFTIFSNVVLLYITSKSRAEIAELKVFMYQNFATKESLRAAAKSNATPYPPEGLPYP